MRNFSATMKMVTTNQIHERPSKMITTNANGHSNRGATYRHDHLNDKLTIMMWTMQKIDHLYHIINTMNRQRHAPTAIIHQRCHQRRQLLVIIEQQLTLVSRIHRTNSLLTIQRQKRKMKRTTHGDTSIPSKTIDRHQRQIQHSKTPMDIRNERNLAKIDRLIFRVLNTRYV